MKKINRIPEFKNHDEEAKFWETHKVSDYMDELKYVNVRFAKNLSEGLHIRLDTSTLQELREKAQKKGIGPTTLVRMWIIEHLGTSRQSI